MNDDIIFNELLQGIKDVLGELKDGQKEIQRDIVEIKITQAEQHVTLVDHTKRSTANEEEIKLARIEFQKQFEKIEDDIKPIQKHINYVKGAGALIGLALSIFTILSLLHLI